MNILVNTVMCSGLGLTSSQIFGLGDLLTSVAQVSHDTDAVLHGFTIHLHRRRRRLDYRNDGIYQTAAVTQLVTSVLTVTAHVTTTTTTTVVVVVVY